MTPGTITVDVQDDVFLIHCLDDSFDMGREGFEMEERVMRLEGGAQAAKPQDAELPMPEPVLPVTDVPEAVCDAEDKEAAIDD